MHQCWEFTEALMHWDCFILLATATKRDRRSRVELRGTELRLWGQLSWEIQCQSMYAIQGPAWEQWKVHMGMLSLGDVKWSRPGQQSIYLHIEYPGYTAYWQTSYTYFLLRWLSFYTSKSLTLSLLFCSKLQGLHCKTISLCILFVIGHFEAYSYALCLIS